MKLLLLLGIHLITFKAVYALQCYGCFNCTTPRNLIECGQDYKHCLTIIADNVYTRTCGSYGLVKQLSSVVVEEVEKKIPAWISWLVSVKSMMDDMLASWNNDMGKDVLGGIFTDLPTGCYKTPLLDVSMDFCLCDGDACNGDMVGDVKSTDCACPTDYQSIQIIE